MMKDALFIGEVKTSRVYDSMRELTFTRPLA